MKRSILFLWIILFIVSCQKEDEQFFEGTTDSILLKSAEIEDALEYSVYIESHQFIGDKEKPFTESLLIGNPDLGDWEDCFIMYVNNGGETGNYVSSAVVKVDDDVVLDPRDFNNKENLYCIELCNLTEQSMLEVEVRGKPGSILEIWIEGIIVDPFAGPEGTFVDERDGNEYKWVRIGEQIWMAENLSSILYNDGSAIPLVENIDDWSSLTSPGYCWYRNDEATYGQIYGALYNWYTVNSSKLAPLGWHIPTYAEWSELISYLGGQVLAGGKLKEAGFTHWFSPNVDATNETGYTALPGGYRIPNGQLYNVIGTYGDLGGYGYWWSATERTTGYAWWCTMGFRYSDARMWNHLINQFGFSVRCIKDE